MPIEMEWCKKIHLFMLSTDDTAGYDGKRMIECLYCEAFKVILPSRFFFPIIDF